MQPFTREDLQSLLSEQQAPLRVALRPDAPGAGRVAPERAHVQEPAARRREGPPAEEGVEAGGRARSSRSSRRSTPRTSGEAARRARRLREPRLLPLVAVRATRCRRSRVVADTFHTKGLVKRLQGEVRYYVLALTKENITLFEGNRETARRRARARACRAACATSRRKTFDAVDVGEDDRIAPGPGGGAA